MEEKRKLGYLIDESKLHFWAPGEPAWLALRSPLGYTVCSV